MSQLADWRLDPPDDPPLHSNDCTCRLPWPQWIDGDPLVECRHCYGVLGVPTEAEAA